MAKSKNERIKKAVSFYLTKLKHVKPQITGNELIKLGLKPGKIFQEITERLRDEILNGRILTNDDEISFINKNYLKKS